MPPLDLDELLELEADSPFARYRNLFACGCCSRLKNATCFAQSMLRGKRGLEWWRDGGDVDARWERWCLECGFADVGMGREEEDMDMDGEVAGNGEMELDLEIPASDTMDIDKPHTPRRLGRYCPGVDILGFDGHRYVWCLSCRHLVIERHDSPNRTPHHPVYSDPKLCAPWTPSWRVQHKNACRRYCQACCAQGACGDWCLPRKLAQKMLRASEKMVEKQKRVEKHTLSRLGFEREGQGRGKRDGEKCWVTKSGERWGISGKDMGTLIGRMCGAGYILRGGKWSVEGGEEDTTSSSGARRVNEHGDEEAETTAAMPDAENSHSDEKDFDLRVVSSPIHLFRHDSTFSTHSGDNPPTAAKRNDNDDDDDPVDFHIGSNVRPKKEYIWECKSKTPEVWEARPRATSEAGVDAGADVDLRDLVDGMEGLEFQEDIVTMGVKKRARDEWGGEDEVRVVKVRRSI